MRTLNEIIVFFAFLFLALYANDVFASKKFNPMSLVMNLGILNAILFLAITFSDSFLTLIFGKVSDTLKNPNIIFSVLSFVYVTIFAAIIIQMFLIFKEFYFLNQKRSSSVYFNTMVFFFLLSVIICTLFIVNLVNSTDTNTHHRIFNEFSGSLGAFFRILMIYGSVYFAVLFFTTLFHIPTAEAFDRKAQEVSSLQYFSKLITRVLDFDELAETVTDIALKVSNADAAWIIWKEEKTLRQLAHKNIGYLDAELITSYIFREKFLKDTGKLFTESLRKFEKRSQLNEQYSAVAITPLKTHNQLRGFLVVAKKGDFIFDDEDKSAINTFSDYASVAIENSRLLEESIEKERLEKELDVAREIQRKILPAKDPVFDKLAVSSVFIPAFEVGGDYYDFFEIEGNMPGGQAGKFGFIIADVFR